MNISAALFVLALAVPTASAFVTPRAGLSTKKYLLSPMHPDRKLPWTAQQTTSTLQYRTLGNTALVNEYLYIYKTENNGIAVMTNATAATSPSSCDTDSLLASFVTHDYAYEGYSYNNNERIIQLQSVVQSLHSQMEQQNRLLAEQKSKVDQLEAEKLELQAALDNKENDFTESMTSLLSKYETLLVQVEEAKNKVVFPEPIHDAPVTTVATVGQIKEWAAQGDQGKVLARQALEEGRVQSHRIAMSFNQRLHAKDQEIQQLKEQLLAERLQRSLGTPEDRARRESQADLLGWIHQVAHVMSNYAKLHALVPVKPKSAPARRQSLFGAAAHSAYNQTSPFLGGYQ